MEKKLDNFVVGTIVNKVVYKQIDGKIILFLSFFQLFFYRSSKLEDKSIVILK